MNLEQMVADKSVTQINAMADKLERIADAKAAAAAKAKAAAAKTAQAKVAANANVAATKATTVTKTTAATAATAMNKSAATMLGACCSSKSLGLGLGLGPWGPVLLAAGGAAGGWYLYKNYLKDKLNFGGEPDAPTI